MLCQFQVYSKMNLLNIYIYINASTRAKCLSRVQLCNPMCCSPLGSPVHGILQSRILEWVAMPFSRGSSQPRDQTHISYISCTGKLVLYHQHYLGSPAYLHPYLSISTSISPLFFSFFMVERLRREGLFPTQIERKCEFLLTHTLTVGPVWG